MYPNNSSPLQWLCGFAVRKKVEAPPPPGHPFPPPLLCPELAHHAHDVGMFKIAG